MEPKKKKIICPECDGEGLDPYTGQKCVACKGEGTLNVIITNAD